MRLGISTDLGCKDAAEWGRKMKDLGCSTVVFPKNCMDDEKTIDAFVEAAALNDLSIAEVGIWRNPLSLDPEEAERQIQYSIGQLKLADRIGAKCCVNITGAIGPIWDGAYKENYSRETWDKIIAVTRRIIDEAEPEHTYYTIETMPWMVPDSPDQYLEIMEAVDRERLGVHMDLFNMIITPQRYFFNEEFMDDCFAKLGPKIKSCHLKNVRLKKEYTIQFEEVSCDKGFINLERYAQLASEADPEMPMIIEHLESDEDYYQSIEYVRKRLGAYLYR